MQDGFFADALTVIPFASLRNEQKTKRFAILKIFNITSNLLLNLIFIIGFGLHAEGVFLANLIASGLTFIANQLIWYFGTPDFKISCRII